MKVDRNTRVGVLGQAVSTIVVLAHARNDLIVAACVVLGLAVSFLGALIIDEVAITGLLGMSSIAKSNPSRLSQQPQFGTRLVVTMWISGLLFLVSLLQLQSTTAVPEYQRPLLILAFLSGTCCSFTFAYFAAGLKLIILAYLIALAVATACLDKELTPFVMITDTLVIALKAILSWKFSSPSHGLKGDFFPSGRALQGLGCLGVQLSAKGKATDEDVQVTSATSDTGSQVSNNAADVAMKVAHPAGSEDYKGATVFSPARGLVVLVVFFSACVVEWSSPKHFLFLQSFWSWIMTNGYPYVNHPFFAVTLTTTWFVVVCSYFTVLDLTHCESTKVQKDYWPDPRAMWAAAWPQLLAYTFFNIVLWTQFALDPVTWTWELPASAPSIFELGMHLACCLVVGDFLIYWEHRIMHMVPFLRNKIHSVHHEYTAVFSWAGGWVHPIEDLIVAGCQVVPAVAFGTHPLTKWLFALFWVTCLIDEHSGHDVWWSPYQILPFTGYPLGGGAAPHDIHHYKPSKNYSFVFIVWDRLFGSFEEVVPEPCNPYVPPFKLQRRSKEKEHSQ